MWAENPKIGAHTGVTEVRGREETTEPTLNDPKESETRLQTLPGWNSGNSTFKWSLSIRMSLATAIAVAVAASADSTLTYPSASKTCELELALCVNVPMYSPHDRLACQRDLQIEQKFVPQVGQCTGLALDGSPLHTWQIVSQPTSGHQVLLGSRSTSSSNLTCLYLSNTSLSTRHFTSLLRTLPFSLQAASGQVILLIALSWIRIDKYWRRHCQR